MKVCIYVIEDDENIREIIDLALTSAGYNVKQFSNALDESISDLLNLEKGLYYSKKENNVIYNEIGQRIKQKRKDLNKTQNELSKLLGIERSTLQKYEAGKRNIPISVIIELSNIFSCSTDYLLKGSNSK